MRKILIMAAAGLMLGGLGFAATPASAAVTSPSPAVAGPTAVENVRMTRHGMMRHRISRRSRMMHSDINSKNPSRPGYMQRNGNTSGGPRY